MSRHAVLSARPARVPEDGVCQPCRLSSVEHSWSQVSQTVLSVLHSADLEHVALVPTTDARQLSEHSMP